MPSGSEHDGEPLSGDVLVEILKETYSELTLINDSIKALKADKYALSLAHFKRCEALESEYDVTKHMVYKFNAECDKKSRINLSSFGFTTIITSIKGYYYALQAKAESSAPSAVPVATQGSNAGAKSHVRLPKINIESFSGDQIHEWPKFHALFTSLVHNNAGLSSVEKFQYLLTLLKGNALKLIEHLHLSDANYVLAFDALKHRYEDKRMLASHYMKQLFEFKPLQSDSPVLLQQYLMVYKSNVDALKAIKLADLSDFLLCFKALSALDPITRQLFETDLRKQGQDMPTFDDLLKFVEGRLKVNELCAGAKAMQGRSTNGLSGIKRANAFMVTSTESGETAVLKCPFDAGDHKPQNCKKFLDSSIEDRFNLVKEHKRCISCLGKHFLRNCVSTARCRHCGSKFHSTWLHREKATADGMEPTTSGFTNADEETQQSFSCQASRGYASRRVLLGTAIARIRAADGSLKSIRMVIDSGSQISCITDACAEMLGLQRRNGSVKIAGIAASGTSRSLGQVECLLSSGMANTLKRSFRTQAAVLPRIAADLPSVSVDEKLVKQFSQYDLADPLFYKAGQVDFLLGADLYCDILIDKPVVKGRPSGIHTVFGLVLLGETATRPSTSITTNATDATISLLSCAELDESLQRFWKMEDVACTNVTDPLDARCETYFVETTKRNEEGRYIVALPFRPEMKRVGINRDSALSRLHKLERRVSQQPELRLQYVGFMDEYMNLGHMAPARSESAYVIPHFCITKESTTTKLRVVFDASAKDSHGFGLNERLLPGPKLQKDISEILVLFRMFRVALCGDIKMMYRQILVADADLGYQHIFWRRSPAEPIVEYELKTVVYGLTPSPYLAQRVLQQLVADEGQAYPLAAKIIMNHTYMDDLVGGASSESEAIKLYEELNDLLGKGGFFPRKWCSSSPNVLSAIPTEFCETPLDLQDASNASVKLLGIKWNPNNDSFSFSVGKTEPTFSKRGFLSLIARLFDPSGWAAPVVFWAKHFIQRLWLAGLDWDDQLIENLQQQWAAFCTEMSQLSTVYILRYIPCQTSSNMLIGFCDASTAGYAAVFYVRSSVDTNVSTHLLMSKSRVAPLKTVSIPRLELCGALLLARLFSVVTEMLADTIIDDTWLFCDSSIVLSWLRKPPHLLKVFEANRAVEILERTLPSMWRHIASEANPADCPSRGCLPSELVAQSLWWEGLSFLKLPVDQWPTKSIPQDEELATDEEEQSSLVATGTTELAPNFIIDSCLLNCSSFSRSLRVIAYVKRFISMCRVRNDLGQRPNGCLTLTEIRNAKTLCARLVQEKHFQQDMKALREGKPVSRALVSLTSR